MEKQLSKEEILTKMFEQGEPFYNEKDIMWSMETHAKQTSIAFAKWITDMGINYWDKDKWEAWEHNSLSSEQLYELYTQSLNQQ